VGQIYYADCFTPSLLVRNGVRAMERQRLSRTAEAADDDCGSRIHDENTRRPGTMRWGLISSWAKDDKFGVSTFNARADTISAKPAFRGAWKTGAAAPSRERRFLSMAQRRGDKPPVRSPASTTAHRHGGLWEAATPPEAPPRSRSDAAKDRRLT
jgi:hypothetical protein